MAQIRVYSDIIKGFIEYTGNTIQTRNSSNVEAQCAIGTGPPGGLFTATTAWRTNGSAAFLRGLTGSTVVKAYLAWMGTPVPDVNGTSTNQNIAVTFKTPLGTNSITGNPAWSQNNNVLAGTQFNIRVADVTSLVTAAGTGQYSVEGIPSGTNYGGWTLMVVWKNSSRPPRFISIDTYDDLVLSPGTLSLTVGGFITPLSGAVNGRAAMVVGSAESWTDSGPTAFGPTVAGLINLSGPNNPVAKFFQMQINNSNSESATVGQLDTTGTLGTFNSPLNQAGPIGNIRNRWDQTNVSISSGLTNSQTQGVFRFGPVNDAYVVQLLSLQIDVQSPVIETTKSVDKTVTKAGEVLVYTCVFKNTGNFGTNNLVMVDTIPSQTSFVSGSFTVNGTTLPSASPLPPSGVNLGPIAQDETKTITFRVNVNAGVNTTISNTFFTNYTYTPLANTTLSGTSQSNNVDTFIAGFASIPASKTVDKTFANVGDTITYTINLRNTGTTTATNVNLIDTIPNGTSFVANSLRLNGTTISGANPSPPSGFTITTIGPNSPATVVFSVVVTTIPSPNPIPNTAFVSFGFTSSVPETSSAQTNVVTTQVNNANLDNIVKGVDKQFAKIGDILTYTITIPNRGSTTANNVIFRDTIPNGTTFVPNSVVLRGTQQNGLVVAPPTGLSIGTIGPNSTVTLSFRVTVTTIPSPNPIPNSGNVIYSYIVDTVLGTTVSGSNNTNIVSTTINSAVINSTKSVTPTNTTVGETIFYTVILTNSGNSTANSVVFIDTIPNDTTFVQNSLVVNGTTISGGSPNPPGTSISSIAPGGRTTITFRVTVDTIPSPNPIPNSSYTNYNFVLNPTTGETSPNTSLSNTVSTFVNPDSNPLKIADKQYAKPGDIITYTVQWQNRLNVTATDVTFIDTIPNDTSFIANSFTINGVTISGASPAPPNGVNVGTIPSQVYTTVTFQVLVNTIPNPNPIPNQAYGRYSYISDPTLGTVTTETATSNIVTTQVNYATISTATKQVNRNYAKVGDILTYTISFTNIGNTTATNIKLIDTIPNGTSFNINSVFVNGTNQPGAVVAPPTGLSIGSLGSNSTTTVVFTVTVNTVPSPNPIPNRANVGYDYTIDPVVNRTDTGGVNTNIANTTINYANLGIIGKQVDRAFANVGNVVTYTITFRNTGNVTATNTIFIDTIPNDTTFLASSVIINNVPNASTVPQNGVLRLNIGNISAGDTATVVFKVTVTTIPNPNPIPNSANVSYLYTVDPSIPNGQSSSNNTNTVNTQVNNANLANSSKFVDKEYAVCGDTITYTISIPNSGNITAINVILNDTVPNGTVLVPNSILVNGVQSSATSPTSVPLGTINPGATTTVSFSVRVQC